MLVQYPKKQENLSHAMRVNFSRTTEILDDSSKKTNEITGHKNNWPAPWVVPHTLRPCGASFIAKNALKWYIIGSIKK